MQPTLRMKPLASRRAAAVAFVAALVAANCDRAPARGPSDVTTTSFSVPNPAAVPGPSHTVDNTGFVDNGGRTSDEVARTQMSGMRPTEMGSDVITGTPGSGWPFPSPLEPKGRRPKVEERGEEGGGGAGRLPRARHEGGIGTQTVSSRVLQVMCERDAACRRSGERSDWPTSAACVAGLRDRVREEANAARCGDDFDAGRVGRCITDLRDLACDVHVAAPSDTSECDLSQMCFDRP
jgi:hypothetical protein